MSFLKNLFLMSIPLPGKIPSWVKLVLLIFLSLHTCTVIFGHNKLKKVTYSIVDTSQCKTVQAEQIYEWITNNIAYDTKQLTKGLKYQSVSKILRRKKAVCGGYTRLFYEMCQQVDIEAYIVSGYTKGFAYVKGDHFNKSSHAWNVVHVDSLWLLIDATWGAGNINYTHGFAEQLKLLITGRCGIKDKIVFNKNPNHKYFAIAPNELVLTHFPNDPKWQLLDCVLPYNTFITDSIKKNYQIDCWREIKSCQHQNAMYTAFIDARNSIKYNPYNRFDIAIEYYNQASQLVPNKHSVYDSTFLVRLYQSKDFLDSSMVFANEFRTISKSIYKKKVSNLSNLYRTGDRAFGRLRKLSENTAKSHYKTMEKLESTLVRINGKAIEVENSIQGLSNSSKCPFDSLQFTKKLFAPTSESNENKNFTLLYSKYNNLLLLNSEVLGLMQNSIIINDSLTQVIQNVEVAYKGIAQSINEMNEFKTYIRYITLDTLEKTNRSLYDTRKMLDKNFLLKIKEAESIIKMMELDVFSEKKLANWTDSISMGDYTINRAHLLLYKIYALKRDVNFYHQTYIKHCISNISKQQRLWVYLDKSKLINSVALMEVFHSYCLDKREKEYNNDLQAYEKIYSGVQNGIGIISKAAKLVRNNYRTQ